MEILDIEIINNIRGMTDDDKMMIIITYNDVVDKLKEIITELTEDVLYKKIE